jgi:glycine cleavage system H lipoate-binding protein
MVVVFMVFMISVFMAAEWYVGKKRGRHLLAYAGAPAGQMASGAATVADDVPAGTAFHAGHAWARVDDDSVVTVGLDRFASTVLGEPEVVMLPETGAEMRQGAHGWTHCRGGRTVPMIAPTNGTVVDVNERLVDEPGLAAKDPYGEGWLLKVRPTSESVDRRNLLDGWLAERWMGDSYTRLGQSMSPDLGVVMNDGGDLVLGAIDGIDEDRVDSILREFFLT